MLTLQAEPGAGRFGPVTLDDDDDAAPAALDVGYISVATSKVDSSTPTGTSAHHGPLHPTAFLPVATARLPERVESTLDYPQPQSDLSLSRNIPSAAGDESEIGGNSTAATADETTRPGLLRRLMLCGGGGRRSRASSASGTPAQSSPASPPTSPSKEPLVGRAASNQSSHSLASPPLSPSASISLALAGGTYAQLTRDFPSTIGMFATPFAPPTRVLSLSGRSRSFITSV
jgi:hypothetical protein